MNKSILAAVALLAGVAIAAPMLAWPADTALQAQNAPADQGSAPTPPMGGGDGMRPMMGGRGMMGGMQDQMGPMARLRGWMMHRSPRERCENRLAVRAGIIAYTVTKLNLTPDQKPLWDKLNGILQSATDRERQLCANLPSAEQRGEQTILDRVNRREQFLSARLQALQQAKPALDALYQSLSPEQKAIVNHPFRH